MTGRRSTCSLVIALATATTFAACTSDKTEHSETAAGDVVSTAVSEDVTVEITTRRLAAETGEPIELMVTIKAPPAAGARLVLPEDGRLGDFDVLSWERAESGQGALDIAERRRILVSTFESGSVQCLSGGRLWNRNGGRTTA